MQLIEGSVDSQKSWQTEPEAPAHIESIVRIAIGGGGGRLVLSLISYSVHDLSP